MNKVSKTFFVQKKHGSYGDVLTAVGLAKLLEIVSDPGEIVIEESSGYYTCRTEQGIDFEQLNIKELQRDPGFWYVQFNENEPDAPQQVYEYFKEQKLYQAERKQNKKARRKQESLTSDEEIQFNKPRDDYLLMQSLRVLQGLGASNKFYKLIQRAEPDALHETISKRLRLYSDPSLNTEPGKESFKPRLSAVQAYNPVIGKGVNKTKANSITVASLPNAHVNWFEEWLKFIGGNIVLNAYPIEKDLKFAAIVPGAFRLKELEGIRDIFLKKKVWSSVKTDVLVLLELTKFLVNHSESFKKASGRKRGTRSTPRDYISGLQTAYFKSLGSGRALINNSFIAAPDWFPISSKKEKNLWSELIKDHERVLNSLDEGKDEEFRLLILYRDFMSGSDWMSFFKYMASYALLYIQRKERNKYASLHSLLVLKGVCTKVSDTYTEILENVGFQEISKAMRNATVYEQYRKSQNKQQFEIHYGLFHELKRKAQFKDQLIAAISEFVNAYNTETARKQEQIGKEYKGRGRVPITALNELINLFDRYPKKHEMIGLLLIAAASCYDDTQSDNKGEKGND